MKVLFLVMFCCAIAFAKDHAKKEMDPKQQEMMKSWHEYATPGAPHKMLSDMVGKWNYTSKFWESAEAQQPEESKGSSTFKMILGGRFLQHDTKGKAMGMDFTGMGLTSYNNLKKKYETLWLDNMGTGMMHGEGTFDEATKTLNDKGEFTCPMTKDQRSYRGEWKIIDKNNMVYSMSGPDLKGKDHKQMEMTFKRK